MYIEQKTDGLRGSARIGLVIFSKSGKTLYYQDKVFKKAHGVPLKSNYYDANTLQDYWISHPKKNGHDSLFSQVVSIDEDVREYYWTEVRKITSNKNKSSYQSIGKPQSAREKLEKALRRRQMDNGWMPK